MSDQTTVVRDGGGSNSVAGLILGILGILLVLALFYFIFFGSGFRNGTQPPANNNSDTNVDVEDSPENFSGDSE